MKLPFPFFSPNSAWIGLAAVAVFVLFWGLNRHHVTDVNEGLRLEPAVEMLETGDFITPRIEGNPYIKKPPLIYWMNCAAFVLFQQPGAWGARFFIALSALALVFFTAWVGKREGDAETGWWAAWTLLVAYYFIHKAQKANIDLPFISTLFAGSYFFWKALNTAPLKKTVLATLIAGVCYGLAALLKGPVILPFFCALLVAEILRRRPRWGRGVSVSLGVLALALALFAPWAWALVQHLGWQQVWEIFHQESIERLGEATEINSGPFWFYFIHLPGAFMPGAFLLLPLAISRPLRQRALWNPARPLFAFLLIFIGGAMLIFSFMAGKEVEYLMPLFPALALLAGRSLTLVLRWESSPPTLSILIALFFHVLAGLALFSPFLLFTTFGPWLLESRTGALLLVPASLIALIWFWKGRHKRNALALSVPLVAVALLLSGYRDGVKTRNNYRDSVQPFIEAALNENADLPRYRYKMKKLKHAHAIWHCREWTAPMPPETHLDEAALFQGRPAAWVVLRNKYQEKFAERYGTLLDYERIKGDDEQNFCLLQVRPRKRP